MNKHQDRPIKTSAGQKGEGQSRGGDPSPFSGPSEEQDHRGWMNDGRIPLLSIVSTLPQSELMAVDQAIIGRCNSLFFIKFSRLGKGRISGPLVKTLVVLICEYGEPAAGLLQPTRLISKYFKTTLIRMKSLTHSFILKIKKKSCKALLDPRETGLPADPDIGGVKVARISPMEGTPQPLCALQKSDVARAGVKQSRIRTGIIELIRSIFIQIIASNKK
ncbi:hypothetical protein BLNAU_22206 [Blattamonas nauphoetae]|uniref:Uncharacterized protein n=1 Tax=Blattamonas nauphoetae TaxID=2049346 RepID=A0ABQ9WTQ9_9EUKA|nr:hypothetical protein BLNAU_22206 [Blattamonas nauphoetae]